MLFKSKPVTKEAIQYDGTNGAEIAAFMKVTYPGTKLFVTYGHLYVSTLEGDMKADPGDWIIKGLRGEFYPCKPDVFSKSYEPADAPEFPQPTRGQLLDAEKALEWLAGGDYIPFGLSDVDLAIVARWLRSVAGRDGK